MAPIYTKKCSLDGSHKHQHRNDRNAPNSQRCHPNQTMIHPKLIDTRINATLSLKMTHKATNVGAKRRASKLVQDSASQCDQVDGYCRRTVGEKSKSLVCHKSFDTCPILGQYRHKTRAMHWRVSGKMDTVRAMHRAPRRPGWGDARICEGMILVVVSVQGMIPCPGFHPKVCTFVICLPRWAGHGAAASASCDANQSAHLFCGCFCSGWLGVWVGFARCGGRELLDHGVQGFRVLSPIRLGL